MNSRAQLKARNQGRATPPTKCAPSLEQKWHRAQSREQAAARIADVLCSMGMLHARDTLVGGELPGGLALRGLSGGERRRLSVAVGILASPSIVFLDGREALGSLRPWAPRLGRFAAVLLRTGTLSRLVAQGRA
jgi:ABC-type branched-subunit amino acid transport system ATPase component